MSDTPHTDLETRVQTWGRRLGEKVADNGRSPAARAERRMMHTLIGDPSLRAALVRFVDVRPACSTQQDLVRHLGEFLEEASDQSPLARRLGTLSGLRMMRLPTAAVSGAGVSMMARRFIAGGDASEAVGEFAQLWSSGRCTTVDLLGEATLTEQEGDIYGERCADTLRVLSAASAPWPQAPLLEADELGPVPRVNLSVKVSALTPHLRPTSSQRAWDGAADRLRALLRLARDEGAHLHVDMESLDTRAVITDLVLRLLDEPEFADGPSAGIVLQGYLTDSDEELDRLLGWLGSTKRRAPFTIRLVKGAYWDHELVQATQHGWPVPVFTDRRSCDRHYERLTRRLLDARAAGMPLRVAIASHNLRSLAHALAYSDLLGLREDAIELQVLRGLGDDTGNAIAACGRRVRVYCPVGDLVAGMAYLVRRLLENTSNDSFLAHAATGADLDLLLEKP